MKKLILTCLVVAGLVTTANAQGLKGKWYATAQVGYSDTKVGGAKDSYFNVLPIVGTFISPDVTVGLAFGWLQDQHKAPVYDELTGDYLGTPKTTINVFAVEPLARKYWNIAGSFFFFGQFAVPMAWGKVKDTDTKISQYGAAASAGIDMVVWKRVSLEFSYNIANFSYTKIGDQKTTNFQLAHVANDNLGFEQGGLLTPISVGIKFFLN